MPSCPTKSFAEFRCPSASPSLLPRRMPVLELTIRTPPARPRSWAGKLASPPKSAQKKRPSNASKPDVPRPKKDGANASVPSLPRILPARPAPDSIRPRLYHAALLSLALLIVSQGSAHAFNDEAARGFRSGSSAFQAGDYATALAAFEAALAAGLSGPAIHFNIGVVSYRLGRYERAQSAFQEVARTPAMAALAYYNLGLVALARDDSASAARWFGRVEQATDDSRLRELASARLAELPPPAPERSWIGYAAVGAGYDDNVALVANSNVLGISDTADNFIELQATLAAALNDSWRLDGSLMLTDYQDLDAFDQLGVQGGTRYRWRAGGWTNDAGLRLGYTLLDGAGFENRRTLSLQTSTQLRPDLSARARYRFNDIDGMNEYSGLTGRRHDASTRLSWARSAWDFGVEYQFEVADYDDATLSATRQQVRMDIERTLASDWSVLLEAFRRHSDYDVHANGSEERIDLALSVTKILSPRWRVLVRYAYTDNAADLAEYDYRGNRIWVGLEASL